MSTALTIDSLSKIYRPRRGSTVTAVDRLSLTIPSGQVFGLLGSHGAGKTTVTRLIGGLLRPTAGRIVLHGHDIARDRGLALQQRAILIGMDRHPQGRRSVRKTLLQAGSRINWRPGALVDNVDRTLTDFELWQQRDQPVHLLRPAEQRIVALACAVLANPPILLLDEPTAGLDGADARLVLSALRRAIGVRTVLLATAHVAVACDLCERIALLSSGRLIATQPVQELLDGLRSEQYEIRVKGHLNSAWSEWFDGLTITNAENGEATITGAIPDQAALHGLLARVHALNLPLLGVRPIEPDVDDVFTYLQHLTAGSLQNAAEPDTPRQFLRQIDPPTRSR